MALLVRHIGSGPAVFDPKSEYLLCVHGEPRCDGVRSFRASRGIAPGKGVRIGPPSQDTVSGLGNQKNEELLSRIAAHDADIYPSTLALLVELRRGGFCTGLITSSRNATVIPDSANIGDAFDVIIDGKVAEQRHLPGKPSPDVFVAAVNDPGVTPSRSVVVEDAISGVAAGHAGRLGLVIGVARQDNGEAPLAAGADVVVIDLAAVSTVGS